MNSPAAMTAEPTQVAVPGSVADIANRYAERVVAHALLRLPTLSVPLQAALRSKAYATAVRTETQRRRELSCDGCQVWYAERRHTCGR